MQKVKMLKKNNETIVNFIKIIGMIIQKYFTPMK